MITSYEVGTVFKIVDRATPVVNDLTYSLYRLEEISAKTQNALRGIGTLGFGRTRRGVSALIAQADKMNAAYGNAFKELEAGADHAAGSAVLLAKAWRDVATAATQAASAGRAAGRGSVPFVPGPGSTPKGRGPAAPSRSSALLSPHIGRHDALPGGTYLGVRAHGVGGAAALTAAGLIGYAAYQEAQIEDIAARALMTGQIKVGKDMPSSDAFKRIRDVIRSNAAKTGYTPKEIGEAVLATERQFGGLNFKKRVGLEDTILPYAAIEARLKETSLPESFRSMVGLAHMTGTYDPKKLPELMRQFSYASMVTPVPITQYERALSYSMPILTGGMRMDPGAVMFLTAMSESAGITSTKSGTWIRSFFERLMPATGILATRNAPKHNAALQQMGLLDDKLRPTWEVKGANGSVDWMQSVLLLSQKMSAALDKMPDAQRLSMLSQVFGERGGGFGALMNLKEFVAQFPVIAAKMKNWKGGQSGILELLAASPVQQGRTAWADLQNVLLDIGQVALPPLLASLHSFDEQLKFINAHWPKQGAAFGLPKSGTLGEALGRGMGEGWLWGAGAGAIAGSVVPGAGTLSGGMLGAAIGAVGGGVYEGGRWLFGYPASTATEPEKAATPLTAVPADGKFHPFGGYRAEGGPVKRGAAYIVGEKRAELFVPDRDGTIIPNLKSRRGGGPRENLPLVPPLYFRKREDEDERHFPLATLNRDSDAVDRNRRAFDALTETLKRGTISILAAPRSGGEGPLLHMATFRVPGRGVPMKFASLVPTGRDTGLSDFGNRLVGRSDPLGSKVDDGLSKLTGSAYLKAQRADLKEQIEKTPGLKQRLAGMMMLEGSPLQTMESLANRTEYMNAERKKRGLKPLSLDQMLHSGFYGPINRGQLPGALAQLQRNPARAKRLYNSIDAVLNGSNTIRGFTDQGMTSDPNGAWGLRHDHMMKGGNIFTDWGGGFGHDAATRFREEQQRHVREAPAAEPPSEAAQRETPVNLHLDGRIVARSTMKHMAKFGNGPARAGRLADYTATRPINV